MKRRFLILAFATVVLAVGCAPRWAVLSEGASTGGLASYGTINVGWIDLGDDRWDKYGYGEEDKDEWAETIVAMNTEHFPGYLKRFLVDKELFFVSSKQEEPRADSLVIRFSEARYLRRTSNTAKVLFHQLGGSDSLDVIVRFVDGRSGKELYRVAVSATSASTVDMAGWSFGGRVSNCFYNLAKFISEKVQK